MELETQDSKTDNITEVDFNKEDTSSSTVNIMNKNANIGYKYTNKIVNTSDKDGENMNDILDRYIDKLDRDQSDLREDIRESERRSKSESDAREQRVSELIEKSIQSADKRMDKMEESINRNDDSMSEVKKHVQNLVFAVAGMAIAVILGIAAMAVTVYFSTK